jgi:hypothetical protein
VNDGDTGVRFGGTALWGAGASLALDPGALEAKGHPCPPPVKGKSGKGGAGEGSAGGGSLRCDADGTAGSDRSE